MPDFFILIFIAIIALAIVGAIHGHKKEKERRELLASWAARRELRFSPERDHGFDERFPAFEFLRSGGNRYAYNIMAGQWNAHNALIFDHHYETHSTDSKGRRTTHHHHASVLMLRPGFPLQPLRIRREGFFDKIAAGFGFNDIDFESAEFSKRFHVKAENRRWAYDVIHTRTMELLLNSMEFEIQCDHEWIALRRTKRFSIDDIEAANLLGSRILEGIPDYLKSSSAAQT